MKKILIAFFVLITPTTAIAQNSKEQINQIAEQFFPIVCKKELPDAINFIKECYQQTLKNNKHIEKCLIIDRYVINIAKHNKDLSKIYSKQINDFINDYDKRLNYYSSIITELKLNNFNKYVINNARMLSDKINNLYIFPPEKIKNLYNSKGELISNPMEYLYKEDCIKNDFYTNRSFLIE